MCTLRASLVVGVSLLGIAADLACPVAPKAAPASQDALHEVVRGDDLHLIAGYYYGDARQWDRIWQANRNQVSNPNRIEPGALLRIPDALSPAEPYADFVARTRPAIAPAAGSPRMESGTPPGRGAPGGRP